MAQDIRDVMMMVPVVLDGQNTLYEAACAMRDEDIGDVLVSEGDELVGIVTDRDIVLRAVAAGFDPMTTRLADVSTRGLVALEMNDTVEDAIRLMSSMAIRRLPVVDSGRPVGMVSLGDLALSRDPDSLLGEISAAPPNN